MFDGWGRTVYRRRWLVLAIAAIGIAGFVVWGTGVFGALQKAGGFNAPGSQSQQESSLAAKTFGRDSGDVVVLYSSKHGKVSDPAFESAVTRTLAALPASKVTSTATYWSTRSSDFVSKAGNETYAVIELAGHSDSARITSYQAISGKLSAPGLTTRIGGFTPTEQAINNEVTSDIGRAEGLSMPILLILLLFIFGGLVAASLPLAVGGIAILGSFTALRLITLFTPVAIYSINITTILGLGLAIDYGLFIVGRFREELRKTDSSQAALARTMATAGRTVAVSGITVSVALASLMLFPETFLRSMGYGGVATVVVDMLAALTVLPALLAVLGPRVNALRVRRSVAKTNAQGDESTGGWYRLASSVMRRPVAYVATIVVVLLALGAPFLHVVWGGTDARVLPATAQARVVTQALSHDFAGNPTAPIESLVSFNGPIAGSPARGAELTSYTRDLAKVPGVTGVQVTGVAGNVARVDLRYNADPMSVPARAIVTDARAVAPPAGAHAVIGGQTAQLSDELSSLSSTLPWMALVMVAATFLLLFLAFGSVVLPVKAIVTNILSLSATFGVIVWIFQWGHLSGLLRFTATGTIDPSTPILMLAILFGLSMDYEVFLLSRIRERYDVTGDNTAAVASGLQRTGGVITSAALLLVIVVGAFSASGITFIKLMGVGMIVALIVDATIVRVLLVPATMRLLGKANWYAPGPLRRLYAKYGINESEEAPQEPTAAPELEPARA